MRLILPFIITVFVTIVGLIGCQNTQLTTEEDEPLNNHNDIENTEDSDDEEVVDEVEDSPSDNDESSSMKQLINIVDDDSITTLVNKQNALSEQYAPTDLVTLTVPTVLENPEINQLREEAAEALSLMFSSAESEDIHLFARSGYRSYDTQNQLFNNYAAQHGEEAANRYSAKPGFSEHQTGLVMDVTSESVQYQLTEEFTNVEEGIWLKENAHQFGFIIRYPKDKEHITGYIFEPWHVRYVGIEVATAIYESGLTYEEFLLEEGIIDALDFEKKTDETK